MDLENLVPPSNLDAEMALLGTLIANPELVDEVDIHSSDFYHLGNGLIFKAMKVLASRGITPDTIALDNFLKKQKKSEDIGGINYLITLTSLFTPDIGQTAKIIQEKALLRKVINLGQKLISAGYNENQDKVAVLDTVATLYDEVIGNDNAPRSGVTMAQLLEMGMKLIPDKIKEVVGISTGFTAMDMVVGGFNDREFNIIAARPSMGKTAFALNSCIQSAKTLKDDEVLAFYSLEQSLEKIFFRVATILLGTDKTVLDFERGNISKEEREIITALFKEVSALPIYWYDEWDRSLHNFKRKMRSLNRRHRVRGVYLDHVGLMRCKGEWKGNRTAEAAHIIRDLQSFAKEMDASLICLHQLNREVEKREDKRPQLSDMKDTGATEESGDIICALYRDDYYNKKSEQRGIVEAIILKGRDRGTGTVRLNFNKTNLRMVSAVVSGVDPKERWLADRPEYNAYEEEEEYSCDGGFPS